MFYFLYRMMCNVRIFCALLQIHTLRLVGPNGPGVGIEISRSGTNAKQFCVRKL